MAEKILLVEDEEKLARFVELELAHEGYLVSKAADGRTGLSMAETGDFDLILLDVMLPEMSGMEVLRRLRRARQTPVILVTARDAVMDKVTGLDMGADDYITKPFEIEELLARIRVALRKRSPAAVPGAGLICAGGLTLDPGRRTVDYRGEPIQLTTREFDLLEMLMENRSLILRREQLLERVWGYDYLGETNVVDVYIRYLRAKIDDRYSVKFIHTVRGVGYGFRDPDA